jgi:hypothetical protein
MRAKAGGTFDDSSPDAKRGLVALAVAESFQDHEVTSFNSLDELRRCAPAAK